MIRRSRLEVLMDIMKVVAEQREVRRTQIMYKANLAWKVLDEALGTMEKKGILCSERKPTGTYFRLTPDGLTLLQRYFEVESVIAERAVTAEGQIYPLTSRLGI